MCRGVYRVAVCPQAFVACNVACSASPFGRRVTRALREKSQDFCASMVESGVQQLRSHLPTLGWLAVSVCHDRWRCEGAAAVGMISTPALISGTVAPLGNVSVASPVVPLACTPTCASFAKRRAAAGYYASFADAKWEVDAVLVLWACGAIGRDDHRPLCAQASCDRLRDTCDAMHARACVAQPHRFGAWRR
eukprot:4766254-Pleurochrysis_carterae.AAC.1